MPRIQSVRRPRRAVRLRSRLVLRLGAALVRASRSFYAGPPPALGLAAAPAHLAFSAALDAFLRAVGRLVTVIGACPALRAAASRAVLYATHVSDQLAAAAARHSNPEEDHATAQGLGVVRLQGGQAAV